MENWVGLREKRLYQTPKNQPLKKRGFGVGFRGGKGGASAAGACGRSPIEYVFELTEVYTAIRNRERGVKCIESTAR